MPNPRYAEENLRHPNDNTNEGSQRVGKKSPVKVGKVSKEAHRIYQQPNRFGMDKKKKHKEIVRQAQSQAKGSSHMVAVRYG